MQSRLAQKPYLRCRSWRRGCQLPYQQRQNHSQFQLQVITLVLFCIVMENVFCITNMHVVFCLLTSLIFKVLVFLLQLFHNNPRKQFNHTKSHLPAHHLVQCPVLPPIQFPSRQQEVKLTLRHSHITGKSTGSASCIYAKLLRALAVL